MMICGNRHDLKEKYSLVNVCKNAIDSKRKEIESFERIMRGLKDAIRNTYRLAEEYDTDPKWRSRGGDWDRRYLREEYPFVFTDEDCQKYKEENWQKWYNPWNDGRDCTGVWFTTGIRIFPLEKCNKTVIYHTQAMDV